MIPLKNKNTNRLSHHQFLSTIQIIHLLFSIHPSTINSFPLKRAAIESFRIYLLQNLYLELVLESIGQNLSWQSALLGKGCCTSSYFYISDLTKHTYISHPVNIPLVEIDIRSKNLIF